MSFWLSAFLTLFDPASAQTLTVLSSIRDYEQVRKLVIRVPDAVQPPLVHPSGAVLAPGVPIRAFHPNSAPLPHPGGGAGAMSGAMSGAGAGAMAGTLGMPAAMPSAAPVSAPARIRRSQVWVLGSRIYFQKGQCYTDSEPPVFSQTYRVVVNPGPRQIDLEEDEATGIDPHLGSKLNPGDRFNSAELQKKYAHELRPLPRPSGAECMRLATGH